MRVAVRVLFDNGHQANSEVVILRLEEGTEPFRVLFWRDLLE